MADPSQPPPPVEGGAPPPDQQQLQLQQQQEQLQQQQQQQQQQPVPPVGGPLVLSADPTQASFPASGGKSTHKLQNPCDQKMIFKVKSSNNNEYRVNPVYGFVDASSNANLEVTRLAGAPKEDRLVVQFAPAPPDAIDAQSAFATVQPIGNLTINLSAT